MTVYVVQKSEYYYSTYSYSGEELSRVEVVGVFSTLDAAKKYVSDKSSDTTEPVDTYEISVMTLDEMR